MRRGRDRDRERGKGERERERERERVLIILLSHVQVTTVFDMWFSVDSRPFKQALLNIIKRWSYMFKQHLIDHVTNRYGTYTLCHRE